MNTHSLMFRAMCLHHTCRNPGRRHARRMC